jgi:hypothetical protein
LLKSVSSLLGPFGQFLAVLQTGRPWNFSHIEPVCILQ